MDPGKTSQRGANTAPVDARLLATALHIQREVDRALDTQAQIGDLYFQALRKTKRIQLKLPFYYERLDLNLSKFITDYFLKDDDDDDDDDDDNDSALSRFLRTCELENMPAAGVVVALMAGRGHRAEHLLRRLGSRVYWKVLVFTVHLAKWRCVLVLLRSAFDAHVSRDSPVQSGLTAWVLKTAGAMSWRDSLAVQVVEFLLPHCQDQSALVAVFDCALAHGACALVEVFTERDVFDLDRLELSEGIRFYPMTCSVLEAATHNLLESPGIRDYARIVAKLIRAGVSRSSNSLYAALVHGRGDLVSLLFRTGATTPGELDFIRTRFSISAGMVELIISILGTDPARVTAVRTQLLEESQGPRSLQNLCLSTMSLSLGCRADREESIGKLRLPGVFKRCLRFDGEVRDFERCLEETPPDDPLDRLDPRAFCPCLDAHPVANLFVGGWIADGHCDQPNVCLLDRD